MEEIKKTAEAVAEIAREVKTKVKPTEPEDTFDYNDVEKKQLAVLEEMETLFPDKYSGKTAATKKFIQTIEAHIEDFKKKNPEAKEEEIADAAAEYREKLGVTWDEEDFAEARISLRTRPLVEENKRLKEKVEGVVDNETTRANQPAISKTAAAATEQVALSIGDAYKELVAPDGSIVKAKADELIADDQLIGETVVAAVEQTNQTAIAIQMAFGGKASVAKLKPHQVGAASFWAREAETIISALDPKDQRDEEGRMFAPRAKYKEMDAKEREKHWVIGAAEVIPIMVNGIAEAARADITKITERDAKKGIVRKESATTSGTTDGTTTETTTKPVTKPESPTSTDPKNMEAPKTGATGGFWDRLRNGTTNRPRY